MNLIELVAHRLLRDNPQLKRSIRNIYQDIFSLVPASRLISPYSIQSRPNSFFGFHDKSPFSPDDRFLLSHRTALPPRPSLPGQTIELGIYQGEEWMEWQPLAKTGAWNWHQGAMLQWLGQENNFIFNDVVNGIHCSRRLEVSGKEVTRYPLPISAVSPDGRYATSYCFVRSERGMGGYGYPHGTDALHGALVGDASGLSLMNLATGETHLMVTLSQLAAIETTESMEGAFHWVTHVQFAPDSQCLVFFHRWKDEKTKMHWTRMYSIRVDGSGLTRFPTDGMVSHVSWKGDGHLIAWMRTSRFGTGYHLLSASGEVHFMVGEGHFRDDGHPSISSDGRWMLTDSYPDRSRMQALVLYDLFNDLRYDIARFHHPRKFVGKRIEHRIEVDLHPRWSRDNAVICVDAAFSGERSLCTIKVGDLSHIPPATIP